MKEFKSFLIGFAVFAFLIFFFALLINAVPASWMRGCEVFCMVTIWGIACYALGSSLSDWWKSKGRKE